jgi:hypothetical protein
MTTVAFYSGTPKTQRPAPLIRFRSIFQSAQSLNAKIACKLRHYSDGQNAARSEKTFFL